jgi:hypothetical protein
LKANSNEARYSTLRGGCLLFVQGDNLYAQRLNLSKARLEGQPELVIQGLASATMFGNAHFSVSSRGAVVWRPGKAARAQLTWFDRKGHILGLAGPVDSWGIVQLSPDERRTAALVGRAQVASLRILEIDKSSFLTLPPSPNRILTFSCLWLPGGDRILYIEREPRKTGAEDLLVEQSASGGGIHDWGRAPDHYLKSLSADGKQLVVYSAGSSWIVPFPPDGSSPRVVTATGESEAVISPDGKWVAYRAQREVFVQPSTGLAPRRQISPSGGSWPIWRADGNELLYINPTDRRIYSVRVDLARGEFGPVTPLFQVRLPSMINLSSILAVTRDGSRILFAQAVEQPEANLIHIAADWTKGIRQPAIP